MSGGVGNRVAPFTYEGAWDVDGTYLPRNVVKHGAGLWLAIAKTTGIEPGADLTDTSWEPLGGGSPIYLEGVIAPGDATVTADVFRPGFRIPADSILRAVTITAADAPVGSALVVEVKRRSTGSTLTTVTVAAGSTTATVDGLAVALVEGDLLRFDVTSVGSTTAAKDVLASITAT